MFLSHFEAFSFSPPLTPSKNTRKRHSRPVLLPASARSLRVIRFPALSPLRPPPILLQYCSSSRRQPTSPPPFLQQARSPVLGVFVLMEAVLGLVIVMVDNILQ